MAPDDFEPYGRLDPHGAAAIPPVTEAMMDHAAHAAAELAEAAAQVPEAAASTMRASADAGERAVEVAADASHHGAEGAERLAAAAEAGVSASSDALSRYNAKLFEAIQANLSAAAAHAAALAQARSVPEAMSVNADHVRRQIDAVTSQGRELAVLAQRLVFGALQPVKDVLPRG